jgi:hypothetical protein
MEMVEAVIDDNFDSTKSQKSSYNQQKQDISMKINQSM